MTKHIFFSLLLGAAVVSAQDFRRGTGYAGGGFSQATGDFGSRHNTGWSALAGGGYKFAPTFGLNLEYNYDQLSYKYPTPTATPIPSSLITSLDGTTKMHGFSLNPRWDLKASGPINVFFTGGYGIYNRKFQITRPGVGTGVICDPWWGWCTTGVVPVDFLLREYSTWKGGFNVGGGVEFGGDEAKFFVDVRYRYIYTSNLRTTYVPITFGVRF